MNQTKHLHLLYIALKMLLHSKKKLIGMLVGATLAAFIVMQQPGTYQGVSDRLVAQIRAIVEPDLWVMSTESWDFTDPTYFNAMDIYRIRSIPGVLWAKKLYRSWLTLNHLATFKTMNWELIGVEPDTLIGLPKQMQAGVRSSIYQANAIIVDGYAVKQFENANGRTLTLGDIMLEGSRKLTITGIAQPMHTYASHPKAYMLNDHITSLSSKPYFIMVKLTSGARADLVAHAIHQTTGYDALTSKQFIERSLRYFREKTPIIIIFIAVAILGFLIGLVIMWQIFSNFTLTHLHQFGMLKMMGVSNAMLTEMVIIQASLIGGVGYFLGFILALLFGLVCNDTNIAFHLTWKIALLGALGIIFIIGLSSYLSILRVLRLDTIELCRELN